MLFSYMNEDLGETKTDEIFDENKPMTKSDGQGETTEDPIFDPDAEKIKEGPTPTLDLGETTTHEILDPDKVEISEETPGDIPQNVKEHEKADDIRDENTPDTPSVTMSSTAYMIPGFEAFMEDASVEVSVNVSDSETIEADTATEAEDVAAQEEEVGDATAEVDEDVQQAEMILSRYEEVEHMLYHVKTFGVDRSFLSLMNSNGQLSRALKITLPSMESFGTQVADPNSAISIACMEGLGDVMRSIGGFFKSLGEKTMMLMQRLTEAVRQRTQSLEKNIQRLRDVMAETDDNFDRVERSGMQVVNPDHLMQMKNHLKANFVGTINKVMADSQNTIRQMANKDEESVNAHIAQLTESIASVEEQVTKAVAETENRNKIPLSNITRNQCIQILDGAWQAKQTIDETLKLADGMKAFAKQFVSEAKQLGEKKNGKAIAKLINKLRKAITECLKAELSITKDLVRIAGLRVRIGKQKPGAANDQDNFNFDDDDDM